MIDLIRPYLSRIIAAPIAAVAAYLFLHWKVNIDTATQRQLAEAIVAWVIPVFAAIWALVHKLIDSKINPADAASRAIASDSKAQYEANRRVRV